MARSHPQSDVEHDLKNPFVQLQLLQILFCVSVHIPLNGVQLAHPVIEIAMPEVVKE